MSITKNNTFRMQFEINDTKIGMSMLWVEKNQKMPIPDNMSIDSPEDVKFVARVLFPGYDAQLRAMEDEAKIRAIKEDNFWDDYLTKKTKKVTVYGRSGDEHTLTISGNGKITCDCWAYVKWNNKRGCHHIDKFKQENPTLRDPNEKFTIEQIEFMHIHADEIESIMQRHQWREMLKNVKIINNTPSPATT
jgi:hypothetical protein